MVYSHLLMANLSLVKISAHFIHLKNAFGGGKKKFHFFLISVGYFTVLSSNPRHSHWQAVFREHQRCACMAVSVGSFQVATRSYTIYRSPLLHKLAKFRRPNSFLCASSIENQFGDDLQKWKKIIIIWLNFGILKNYDQQCL